MRSAALPLLILSGATLLVIMNICFGSPVHHDQYNDPMGTHRIAARSADTSFSHAVARMTEGAEGNRHLQRKNHQPDVFNQPSYISNQPHDNPTTHLQLHPDSSSTLNKRSLARDLTVMGLKLIWDHADIIMSSTLAYYRMTSLYQNLTLQLGSELMVVRTHIITYGVFRLTFTPVADALGVVGEEFARAFPNGLGQFVREFAQLMMFLTMFAVLASFRILAFGVQVSIWITLVIMQNGQEQDLITAPT